MNPITILGFEGANLDINPRMLPGNIGTSITNAEPGNNDLKPFKAPLAVATVPFVTPAQTIYRMGRDTPSDTNYWLSWTTVVNAVRSLDSSDTTERTYFTGSGTPKWTNNVIGLAGGQPYPQASRELSVPAPSVPPVVALTTDGSSANDQGTRFYVSTFVNDLGWESAPSPPDNGTVCRDGAIVAISGLPAPPSGNYGINRRRIYRTQPGTTDGAANFYFLMEVGIGVTSVTDDARAVNEVIPTIGLLPPPVDGHGMTGLWNGMTAMISGKTIVFGQPYQPYAVPVAFDLTILDTPVALAKWEQNLLVMTTGQSVILNGQDPSSMSESGIYSGHACIGPRGATSFTHGVVWPSNEGLAYTGTANMLTLGIIHPHQWRLLNPASFIGGRYGRWYVASFDDLSGGGHNRSLIVDPLNPGGGVFFLDFGFDACFYDELVDALFILDAATGTISKFDASPDNLTVSYTSKVFHQVGPRNFGFAKVVADEYPVTFKVFTEQVDSSGQRTFPFLRCTRVVSDPFPFRLPSGFGAEDWQVSITAPNSVQAIHLATEIVDLRA